FAAVYIDGCGNDCGNRGKCIFGEGSWKCECQSDTFGQFCETRLEQECSDKIDNDGDFLTDCEDSECCNHPSCRDSTLCQAVPEPHQILLRQQAVPPHASFFQKVRFLIDSDSLQHYADTSLFNER
uniref:EGF-like domain-containing protein n=1 Tax=Romanomermis culicivorax TaxID=13658 RepID=A0A915IZ72_ROMCU